MDEKVLRILEYDKIINMLSECALSNKGKDMCLNLKPSNNIHEVNDNLNETKESIDLVLKWGNLPLEGIRDVSDIIRRCRMGFVLSPKELLDVCDLLRCSRNLKNFMKDGAKKESFPILYDIIDSLFIIKNIEESIENTIIGEDEISDRASAKLYDIRKKIREKNSKIREKLQSMIQTYSKYLQDPIVTIRGDRYVIPVKAEYKGSVPGLVHDQSSSGSTLFIEPMAVVEMNNDIKELMLKEKIEIERILSELTQKVSQYIDEIEHNNENAAYLDFLMAKAKLSLDFNGTIPTVNDKGFINIKSARHPLINKEKVVPIDIRIGDTYKALVITGPNTGGKTVTLKTAGLLTLMAMSGLAIPAKDGSEISVFKKIFADIGDEQSIEQSLSTFSSHMTNIVDILKNVDEKSLVLVDELGAGTDPVEGAALAMAILEKLYNEGSIIIATTHYSEIKVFAMEKEGFENASVEFDIETLRPTYRLLIGIPGKSNAFEISKRLGLEKDVIDKARSFVSKDTVKFEDVIQSLQNKTITLQRELEKTQEIKREIEELKNELSQKKYKLESQRENIIKKAQEEAFKIVRNAKDEADSMIKEINDIRMKAKDIASIKEAEEIRKKLKIKLEELDKESEEINEKEGMVPADNVKIGDEVYVTTLSQKGEVISEVDSKGEVTVQIGIMKINVPLSKLLKVLNKKKEDKKVGTSKLISQKVYNVSSSIDLRGQTLDEALYNLDKYLDDAFLAGLCNVRIIHGKGTGVLREGIQSFLKKHHYVKSIRIGDINEGGSGVTVAELKR